MFDRTLNAALPNNLLQHEESLRGSSLPLRLHKGISDSPCLLICWFTPKQQDEILHWPCVVISFSNTRNENHKVLEQSWRHFTSLTLYQYSQIAQPSPRVTSTSNRIKKPWLASSCTRLRHLASGISEGVLG